MDQSFNVYIHKKIEDQICRFVETKRSKEKNAVIKQIYTALKKLKYNPTGSQNVPFHENRNKALVGKIRKMYVGGNERYRLMNIVLTDKSVVLPFYISEVQRSDFKYDDVDWIKIADEIHKDFLENGIQNFKKIYF